MVTLKQREVTVIFYDDNSVELMHEVHTFAQSEKGRVIIPESFKKNKSIIAVCAGEIKILNRIGDRIHGVDDVANG